MYSTFGPYYCTVHTCTWMIMIMMMMISTISIIITILLLLLLQCDDYGFYGYWTIRYGNGGMF